MLGQIISQTDKAARLLESAQRAAAKVRGLRSGDPVSTPLVTYAEFSQGSAPSANLIFNVPADADFWAYRLLFYPYCKIIDPVNGTPDEVVYRPTSFTNEDTPGAGVNPDSVYTDFNSLVDIAFALIYDGKEMQNIDIPVGAAYCTDMLKFAQNTAWGGSTQTPAGMPFDIPFFIPRSKSLTVRITPTFLGIRTIVETIPGEMAPVEIIRQHKYKIVAVLEGEKKVAAFR